MNLDDIYRSHPLTASTILARVSRQKYIQEPLSEWQVAIDPATELTDQNHEGGVQAVLELASAARITSLSRVLDVGAGLGGSARVLSHAYGCRTVAVERDESRVADCVRLCEILSLADLVTTLRHDALMGPLPGHPDLSAVDVLWGQSAWVHFQRIETFLDDWLPVLDHRGRVAISDSFLVRDPNSEIERQILSDLQTSWAAHFVPLSRLARHLTARGFRITHQRDVTAQAALHFQRLLDVSLHWPAGLRTDSEVAGWQTALAAIERRLVQFVRFVAAR
jgi:SAM-dependent methyltransferase